MIFLKNKGQLKNILHHYKVPEPDEKEIKDTVQLGQQQMRSLLPSRTTYSTLFKTQIRYITPYLLWAQLFIVALRSEEHTSELQSRGHLVCRLLLEKKKTT